MQKLTMHTKDITAQNIDKLKALFPNAVTEIKDEDGTIREAIDFDVLRQELSHEIVEGREERYQFTWPDKKKAILEANSPIAATLRPIVEDSVGKDGTLGKFDSENLYIEGDNLDVLKLLRETYLGQVKMIYIDPPYNTGNDFIYNDDFAEDSEDFLDRDGQYDDQGNRMVQNTDTNGRFHTDWLNMIYPRLKLAKDLLSENGVIFISIDYNENYNLRKITDEIFGQCSFVGEIYWESKTKSQNTETSYNKLQPKCELMLVYSLNSKIRFNLISKGKKEYLLKDEQGYYREYPLELMNAKGIRGRKTMIYPISDEVTTVVPPHGKQWKLGQNQVATFQNSGNLFIKDNTVIIKMRPEFEKSDNENPFWGFFDKTIGTTENAKSILKKELNIVGFDTIKPIELIKRITFHATSPDSIIFDFFSGSATTAHAVMQLNAEDGGKRKFIMVQLPEVCDEKSEAAKAGYKNICEIGKERIRRAGKKIKAESPLTTGDLDIGFRCLRIDSSNMKDVYYRPKDFTRDLIEQAQGNIKPDRSGEDLLFQVMLELGISLSAPIAKNTVQGKTVFDVDNGVLLACFDSNLTEELITEIAKKKPYYFVMADRGYANDCVATNFDQIFETYSHDTIRRVL